MVGGVLHLEMKGSPLWENSTPANNGDYPLVKAKTSGVFACKLFMGYNILSYLAVEFGYAHFKEAFFVSSPPTTARVTHQLAAFDLVAKARLLLPYDVSLYALLGGALMQSSLNVDRRIGDFPSISFVGSGIKDTKVSEYTPTFGLGGSIKIAKQWHFLVHWQQYLEKGLIAPAEIFAVGVRCNFS